MATADLITAFLNNEMSPEQERGFLLTVASSDTLRLELKSHVMLDRIFVAQSERAEVPEAVRGIIFASAGVSISGARPDDAPRSSGAMEAGRRLSRSFMSRFVRGGMLVLVASAGFAAGYFSGDSDGNRPLNSPALTSPAPQSTPSEISSPRTGTDVTPSTTGTSTPPVVESPVVTRETSVRNSADRRSEPRSNTASISRPGSTSVAPTGGPNVNTSTPASTTAPAQTTTNPAVDPAPAAANPPSASVKANVRSSSERKQEESKKEEDPRMP